MLAAMSTHAKQLETAEVAYAAINEADKVIQWKAKSEVKMAYLSKRFSIRLSKVH